MVFGGGGEVVSAREEVERILAEYGDDPLVAEHSSYVTLRHQREIEVNDEEVADWDILFLSSHFDIDEEARSYARPCLDLVATIISTVEPRAFANLVLDDRVLLFAEGKRPSGITVSKVSAELSVIRGGQSVAELTQRLSLLAGIDPGHAANQEWLHRIAHWRVQALVENDPWKQFLWSFLALEILANKLFDVFHDSIVKRLRLVNEAGQLLTDGLPLGELVWDVARMPLQARFALVAAELFPDSAADDVARFRTAKKARDRLSHGSLRSEDELPRAVTQELLETYLTGSLKRLLLNIPARAPWDTDTS